MSICSYCDKDITAAIKAGASECPFCFTAIEAGAGTNAGIAETETGGELAALILKRVNGRGELRIDAGGEPVQLGRSATGADVFAEIPYVSRNHCTITFDGNDVFITDDGSTNGTFIGAKKVDCFKSPNQKVNQNEILYFGQEAFQVELEFAAEAATAANEDESPAGQTAPVKGYTCTNCYGYESDVREFVCPKCNAYNS